MLKRNIFTKLIVGFLSLALLAGLWYPNTNGKVSAEEQMATEDGLVANWNFDENYQDSALGLNTELGGKKLTYIDGVYGKAAVFNGKDTYLYVNDDRLNLGNSREDSNSNFTISAWINLGDSKNAYKYLVDKGEHSEWTKNDGCNWDNPYSVYFDGTQPIAELSNYFYDSEGGIHEEGTSQTGGKYVQANEWFLLTVTYDGNRVKIYHNDELLTQSNYTDGLTFNNDALYIGVDGKLQYFFKGAVDDLKIYNKTLSYDDVSQIYNDALKNSNTIKPYKEVAAYYPFDGSLEDLSKFDNDAEKVAASGSMEYVLGMNGSAVLMSKGSYICVPAADQLNLKNEFTISFWLKNAQPEGDAPILYQQNPAYTDDNDNEATYSLYLNSWQNATYTTINMNLNLFNPDNWCQESGGSFGTQLSYQDNKIKNTDWIHYAYTYLDGQLKCYINGKLLNKSEKSDQITIANASGDLLIGYDGDSFLSGTLDELKIYPICLDADGVLNESKRIDSIGLNSSDKDKIKQIGKGKSVTLDYLIFHDVDLNVDFTMRPNSSNVILKSSNKKIFTISKDGKITGIKAGKAKLTISFGPHTAVYNIEVK